VDRSQPGGLAKGGVKLGGHVDWVNDAAFSRDGQFVVTAGSDDSAIVHDRQTGAWLGQLRGHGTAVVSVAVRSPDELIIADPTTRTVTCRARDGLASVLCKDPNGAPRRDRAAAPRQPRLAVIQTRPSNNSSNELRSTRPSSADQTRRQIEKDVLNGLDGTRPTHVKALLIRRFWVRTQGRHGEWPIGPGGGSRSSSAAVSSRPVSGPVEG
jgi:WD domain, G-beta repeat